MTKLQVYSSSAGSGKTYTLTRTYLKLLLASPDAHYFKRILAITFTNDAANEMKERILGSLEKLAQAPDTDTFAQELSLDLDLEVTELLQRARKTHDALIQDYSDFHVKTIDSFMNQVVQQFTEDLDLPFHFETELEAKPLLEEAVDRVLEMLNLEVPSPLSTALLEVAEEVVEQNKSWTGIRDLLVKSSQDMLNDQHYFQIQKLAELEVSDFQTLSKQLKDALKNAIENLRRIGQEGHDLMLRHGISPQDFYQGNRGLGVFFTKLKDNPEDYLGPKSISSYFIATIEDQKWTGASAKPEVKAAIKNIQEPLTQLFNQYRKHQEEEASLWKLRQNIQKDLFRLALILQIKQAFDEVLLANNQVFISDFNRRILEIVLHEPVPFIYERLGEKFNHLLIDEFQDTSEIQFFNLLPLLENGLAQGYFNMVVGDAKQAIYRWRGGKMSLLVHLANQNLPALLQSPILTQIQREQFFGILPHLERANLTTNYRSTQEIISFNNQLFDFILQKSQSEFPFLAEVYQDYFQNTPASALSGGHVEVQISTKEEWLDQTYRQLLHFHEEGYAWGDMACLFRKNDLSSQLAEYLVSKNIPIATSDSLLLSRAWEIQVLIGLLKAEAFANQSEFLVGPLALYAQMTAPQQAQLTWLSSLRTIDSWKASLPFWTALGVNMPENQSTLYSKIERWAHALGFFGTKGRTEYIVTFLEFVLQTTSNFGHQPLDFLEQWEKKKNSLSVQTPSKNDAITIQTIHKSKGLAYPVVLLPHLHWSTIPKPTHTLWMDLTPLHDPLLQVETTDRGTRRLKSAPLPASNDYVSTDLKDQVLEEQTQTYLEALNMLYVALTRPEEKLWISLNLDQKKETSVESILHTFLQKFEPKEPGVWVLYEGVSGKLSTTQPEQRENQERDLPLIWQKTIDSPQEKLKLRRSAERFFDLQTADRSKDRGTKIHALLADITSALDVEAVIQRAVFAGWIAENEAPDLQEEIQGWLEMSDLSPYFAPGLTIDRERDIILPNGKLIRPDRVVYFPNRTVVIDFKTGQIRPSYVQQLQQYAGAFEQMKFPAVEAWLVYLDEKVVQQAYP